MKNFISIATILAVLAGCQSMEPIAREIPKNNPTYEVQYLFEHDGCRVYRFQDGATWVYFTNCRGETASHPDSTTVIRNSTNMKSKNR